MKVIQTDKHGMRKRNKLYSLEQYWDNKLVNQREVGSQNQSVDFLSFTFFNYFSLFNILYSLIARHSWKSISQL